MLYVIETEDDVELVPFKVAVQFVPEGRPYSRNVTG
jgi:hypothetical protein